MGPRPLVARHLGRSVEARLRATSRVGDSRDCLVRNAASVGGRYLPCLSLYPSLLFYPTAFSLLSASSLTETCSRKTLFGTCVDADNVGGRVPATSTVHADATAAEGCTQRAAGAHADRNRVAGRLRRRRGTTARGSDGDDVRDVSRPPLSIGRILRETVAVVDRCAPPPFYLSLSMSHCVSVLKKSLLCSRCLLSPSGALLSGRAPLV